MRSARKALKILAGGLVSLGILVTSAHAQAPLPKGGSNAFPPVAAPPQDPGPPPGAFGPGAAHCPPDFPNLAPPSPEGPSAFEMRRALPPNGFNEDLNPCRPIRWHFSAEQLFIRFDRGDFPVLATTGAATDAFPGALGQRNTTSLPPLNEPGLANGFRVGTRYWLCDPEVVSLTANFFAMEQRSEGHFAASGPNGTILLARPYINAVTNREDADLRSFPGAIQGTISDTVTTRLMGAEANVNWHNSYSCEGGNIALFGGVRWLRLDERYNSFDTSATLGADPLGVTFSDTFTTYNQFVGGQVGVDLRYKIGCLTLGAIGKVAAGPNFQSILINGATVATDTTTGAFVGDSQGLFAQRSNVGRYSSTKTAILPEVEGKVSLDITQYLRFNVGYSYMYLNNTVRPGDQINRVVNIQPLQAPGAAPLLPGPPTFRQSTFNAQMLSVGLEFLF